MGRGIAPVVTLLVFGSLSAQVPKHDQTKGNIGHHDQGPADPWTTFQGKVGSYDRAHQADPTGKDDKDTKPMDFWKIVTDPAVISWTQTGVGIIVAYLAIRTLKATEVAANAAQASVTHAENSLVLVERAWITFGQPIGNFKVGSTIVIPVVTNTGKSPAIMKRMGAFVHKGTSPPDLHSALKRLNARSSGIVAPNESYSLASLDIPDVLNPGETVYFVAGARYEDIFGKRHRSLCIWEMDGPTRTFAKVHVTGFHRYT